MEYVTILYAVLAALIYAFIWYAKSWATTTPPESLNYVKLLATLIVGAAVGLAAAYTGNPITTEAMETQLIAYGAVTALIETILKTILAKLGIAYPGTVAIP